MSELIIDLEQDLTYEQLRARVESITREYSLAVVEGTDNGYEYPDAPDNIRFLNDLIFDLSFTINDLKISTTP